jgi:hypothetical protein
VKHDRSENNKDDSVAKTSLIIASEIKKVAQPEKKIFVHATCSTWAKPKTAVARQRIVGRTRALGLRILVNLWRYSPLGSTKLSYLIGSVERLIGLSIASNG